MATVKLEILSHHIAWLRGEIAGEASADLEAEVPHGEDLDRDALDKLKALADSAIAILDVIGYVGDPVDGNRTVEVEVSEAGSMIRRMCKGLGEEMLVAVGHYDSNDYDAGKVREVCERGLWLTDLREQVASAEEGRA